MDSVKTDNETELTSTVGNVLSVSNKDEKNDTSDATPTSSTDANTISTCSPIVSDDPISSTSSDIENKLKSSEANMQQSVEENEATQVSVKCTSGDHEADLLEINISNVSTERITEDVEDLVHDLESLLGESTDSFNIPIKRKEERKSVENQKTLELQKLLEGDQETLCSGEPLFTQPNEGDQCNDAKEKGDSTDKTDLTDVQEIQVEECNIEESAENNASSIGEEIQVSGLHIIDKEESGGTGTTPVEPQSALESKGPIELKDSDELKVNDSVDVIIETAKETTEFVTENIEEKQQAQTSDQITLAGEIIVNEDVKDNKEQAVHETEITNEIVTEPRIETIVQDAESIMETEVCVPKNETPEDSSINVSKVLQSMPDVSSEDHNVQTVLNEAEGVEDEGSILGDIKTETKGSLDEKLESTETISTDDKETEVGNLAEPVSEESPGSEEPTVNFQDSKEIEKDNLGNKDINMVEIKLVQPDVSCVVNSVNETGLIALDTEQSEQQYETAGAEEEKHEEDLPSNTAELEQNTNTNVASVLQAADNNSEETVKELDIHENEDESYITHEAESQLNIPKSAVDVQDAKPETDSSVSQTGDETASPQSLEATNPEQLDAVQVSISETSTDIVEPAVTKSGTEAIETTSVLEETEEIHDPHPVPPVEMDKSEEDNANVTHEVIGEGANIEETLGDRVEDVKMTFTVEDLEATTSGDVLVEAINLESMEISSDSPSEVVASLETPPEGPDLIAQQAEPFADREGESSRDPTNERVVKPSEHDAGSVKSPMVVEKGDIVQMDVVHSENENAATESSNSDIVSTPSEPISMKASVEPAAGTESAKIIDDAIGIKTFGDDIEITESAPSHKLATSESGGVEYVQNESGEVGHEHMESLQCESAEETSTVGSSKESEPSEDLEACSKKAKCSSEVEEIISTDEQKKSEIAEETSTVSCSKESEPSEDSEACSKKAQWSSEEIKENILADEQKKSEIAEETSTICFSKESEPSEDLEACSKKAQCSSEEVKENISDDEQNKREIAEETSTISCSKESGPSEDLEASSDKAQCNSEEIKENILADEQNKREIAEETSTISCSKESGPSEDLEATSDKAQCNSEKMKVNILADEQNKREIAEETSTISCSKGSGPSEDLEASSDKAQCNSEEIKENILADEQNKREIAEETSTISCSKESGPSEDLEATSDKAQCSNEEVKEDILADEQNQREIAEETSIISFGKGSEPSEDLEASSNTAKCGVEEIKENILRDEQNMDVDTIKILDNTEGAEIQVLSPSIESDSGDVVPVLELEADENIPAIGDSLVVEDRTTEMSVVAEELPGLTDASADLDPAVPAKDLQGNFDAVPAAEPEISEAERKQMEALRKAVESITDVSQTEDTADTTEVIKFDDLPMNSAVIEVESVSEDFAQDSRALSIVTQAKSITRDVSDADVVVVEESVEDITVQYSVDNCSIEDTKGDAANEIEGDTVHAPGPPLDKILDNESHGQLPNTLPDSSQSASINEEKHANVPKERDVKPKTNERPRRHKKSSADNKLEELSINVDVPDKEKPYSPKVTIKPIKAPDDEVSTTSNSDTEIGKGSLKMTITKQSDKMHSILKICDPDCPEPASEPDEPIPKLIIKPKIQQIEQHSPKMSTRSGRQVYSPTSSTQRSGSPRITIKPVVKPDKMESVSPLKIKIKPEEGSKKHSPKLTVKAVKPEDDATQENIHSPRKVTIKPVVKPIEVELVQSPRITIKPIPKPESEKESLPPTPRISIKPIKKQEDDHAEMGERERSSPKITIKPVVKPPEADTQSGDVEEEVKERIVLKINKGNLPTPTKESKKREHSVEDDKSEKLAKITVKFSKGGGHPHIVHQTEESNKRIHDEHASQERSKKQKTEGESLISTRSKHKQEAVTESSVETRSKQHTAENSRNEPIKSKQKDSDATHESLKTKHAQISDSPIEPKRAKLRDSAVFDVPEYDPGRLRHRDAGEPLQAAVRSRHKERSYSEKSEEKDADDVTVVEAKLDSPIVISEDSQSQDSGSCVIVEDVKDPLSDIPVFEINLKPLPLAKGVGITGAKSETAAPMPATPATPSPRKRGRPRKVVLTPQEKLVLDEASKPKQESPNQVDPQPVPESGRPKRSCRGQSARATLGIKPRKPRGPGRGRGSKRGMGDRSVPMKPERVPKLTKAKLKLMQESIKQQIINPIEPTEIKVAQQELTVFDTILDIKSPASVLPLPDIPLEVPVQASPSPVLHVPSPQTSVPSPAQQPDTSPAPHSVPSPAQQPVASPKPAHPLAAAEASLAVESASGIPSTSRADSTEIVMVDEETRMSADTSSRAQTPAKQITADAVVEESQSSVHSTVTTESGKAPKPNKTPRLEVQEPEGAVLSADQLTEYYWNGNGPFMLQEQVAQFLGIKSFKRKYPGITRRMLEMQERDFIRESGLASEHMCDLGLTAVNSADILDIMYSDFQEKYEEYCKHQRDRQAKELINKQRALNLAASQEKNKADITEQAVHSAAQWNASFNKVRKEQRKACMDLQTLTVHFPKGKMKQINKPKVGDYPIALVPGQFTDYYKEFTPTEINNLPINTMCYDAVNLIGPEESDDSGSDGSESESDSSSSSSGSGSDSSSGVEDCKLCKHTPRKGAPSK